MRPVPLRHLVVPVVLVLAACGSGAPSAPAQGGAGLHAVPGGDGDSWRDTAGREYRLGLVNTPEVGECFADEATARRKDLVAGGFRSEEYATDRYGRAVSVVTAANGTNVNVSLARGGYADDRYLARYRDENPALARELDEAFAAARAGRAGLWGACPPRPSPPRSTPDRPRRRTEHTAAEAPLPPLRHR